MARPVGEKDVEDKDVEETGGREDVGTGGGGGAPARAPNRLRRTVALVGLMGAGKTAVGKRVASALGARFRDADDEIERAAGMTIPEIFELYGEPYFRDRERRVIARLLDDPPHLLATGGGAYMSAETRKLLKERAFTLWLKADLDTLVARTSRRSGRPLLKSGDPRKTLAKLMDVRYPVYAEADAVVETRNGPHEATMAAVLEALGAVEGLVDEEARK